MKFKGSTLHGWGDGWRRVGFEKLRYYTFNDLEVKKEKRELISFVF